MPEVLRKFKVKGKGSQRDVMLAKIAEIINKSVGDCCISLIFRTNFDLVTHDVPQIFKVRGQGRTPDTCTRS